MKRKLLFGERVLHGDGSLPFNGVIPFRLRGVFEEVNIQYALLRIQQKHPWLNAFVQNDDKLMPWFIINEAKPIRIPLRIVNRTDDSDWQTEVHRELLTPFDTASGPLLRLVWMKDHNVSDMIITIHHCLCDGGSAMSILAELLQILDDPNANIGTEAPIKGIEDIIPPTILNNKTKQIKAKLIGSLAAVALKLILVKKKPNDRGKDYMIHWKFDEELSKDIIVYCKSAGITVNTMLCAVLLSAFKEVRKDLAHNKVSCPVDIRRFAPEIKKDQLFAFGLMLVVSAHDGLSFLDNIKAMQKDVDQKSAKLDPYGTMMMMESAHPALDNFTNLLKNGKSTNDCMFSNLGKIDIPHKYGSFELETIFSPGVIGPLGNTTTLVTSTYRGQMDFSFIASEGFIPYNDAMAIKNEIIAIIKRQISHESKVAV
ncbi:condensation domain-containing protein [Mucilaginibacter aquaedulcis]|uniref:condensation domain-containing protein n=1 Tax=Mucilaginibacter aquaedulcis TaxID=1187081 RepID=UPI0025B4A898|nr:condensation domain-containing protein [Mucilaginibacter aquaedulcis]MDN3548149.1 condensation domain-containing protein [Mucilaginibacter aquaedulcis]